MGLSKPRDNKTFQGLVLDEALASRKIEPRCGLEVVHLKSGGVVHSMNVEGVVSNSAMSA